MSAEFFRSSEIWRDINFACPIIFIAQHVAAYGSPAYPYELNVTAGDAILDDMVQPFDGVFHISDVPFIFDDATQYNKSAVIAEVQKLISGSWTNFVANGEPSGAVNTTLQDWPLAFSLNSRDEAEVTKTIVRMIGGPSDEANVFGVDTGVESVLLTRCKFINSAEFYAQLQT